MSLFKDKHEAACVLTQDHYGPCAPIEREFYVADASGNVLWRRPIPKAPDYSNEPAWEAHMLVYKALHSEAIAAAFQWKRLPSVRHHSRLTETVSWPIEVQEINGDRLLLDLPIGQYTLNARRAKAGEVTSEVASFFGGAATGFGQRATEDTDSPSVRLLGRVGVDNGTVYIQPDNIEYADGTRSGWLGCYPRDLVPFQTNTVTIAPVRSPDKAVCACGQTVTGKIREHKESGCDLQVTYITGIPIQQTSAEVDGLIARDNAIRGIPDRFNS